jgi:hypothetical protein
MWSVVEGNKRNHFVCAYYEHYLNSDGGEAVIMKGIFWQLIIILIFQNLFLIWLTHTKSHKSYTASYLSHWYQVRSQVIFLGWRIMFYVFHSPPVHSEYHRYQSIKLFYSISFLRTSIMIRLCAECVSWEVRLTQKVGDEGASML